jgi:CBS domain-containing protein
MQARDLMTTEVVTVTPDTPVAEIAKALIERHVSAVPVVGPGGELVGMVSEGDLMLRTEIGSDRPRSWWLSLLTSSEDEARSYVRTHGRLAKHVMTSDVVTVAESTPVAQIARLLEQKRIKRVPVVEGGRLVGLVSRADVLRALAAQAEASPPVATADDRALRDAAMKAVKDTGSGAHVNVIVSEGTIHLWGLVDSNAEAEAVRVAVENVAGTGKVESHLAKRPPYAV